MKNSRSVRLTLSVLLASVTCTGAEKMTGPPPTPTPATVTVNPSAATVPIGQTQQLDAIVKDTDGNAMTGRTINWSSSANNIASVSNGGVVSALATGTATITATEAASGKFGTATITVPAVPLAISTASLAGGTVGTDYSQTIAATGGLSPYAWSADALPGGLSINATTGVISGKPTAAGTFNVTVTVSDAATPKQTASKQFSIVIAAQIVPLAITTTSLPAGAVGSDYSQTVAATGGQTPYTWSVSGTLPPGLSINASTGVVSGKPTAAGSYDFTVTAKDAATPQQSASKALSITVAAVVPPLGITTASLTNGTVGADYSQPLQASGGQTPYSWSVGDGFPAGLSLNTSTGVISGKPTAAGTFNFTVTVTDASAPQQSASKALSITIAAGIPPLGIATASLANGTVGADYSQTLAASGGQTPYTWSVSGNLPGGLTLNTSTGAITGKPTAAGTFDFTINVTDASTPQQSASKQFSIVIVQQPVGSVSVTPPSATLIIGATQSFSAVVKDDAGNTLTDRTVTWSTSNAGVATIDAATGVATAVGAGTATITATSEGKSGTATITVTAPGISWSSIAGGAYAMSCGLINGTAYCWGYNFSGQIGDGTSRNNRTTPTQVVGGIAFNSIAVGSAHTCGISTAGTAYCWGLNLEGELGDGTTTDHSAPAPVAGGISFAALALGAYHTCGLSTSGIIYCWGANDEGELGDGSRAMHTTPAPIAGTFSSIAAGQYHNCALTSAGTAYCWGANFAAQIGDGSLGADRLTPVPVAGSLVFTQIALGGSHSCGLQPNGSAYCWGEGVSGQLGNGSTSKQFTPTGVGGGLSFTSIALGSNHTCAIALGGTAYCWGRNDEGELGDGTNSMRLLPTQVVGGISFKAIAPGWFHTCALANNGAYCWGMNDAGELGNGSTSWSSVPVAVRDP